MQHLQNENNVVDSDSANENRRAQFRLNEIVLWASENRHHTSTYKNQMYQIRSFLPICGLRRQ